jgi:phosphopantothenoylcysteine decarboxylase / phosphopantothenate---cysteine ligase
MQGRLQDRRILMGVTGGIAAYKACEVLRRLQREGAEVRVAMTGAAQKFVAPLTFETLSMNEVVTDMFPSHRTFGTRHVHWAEWAECLLICPATMNCIGKIASGIADDFLSTLIAASRCPVVFAPSMDLRMAAHPVFLSNCDKLKALGYGFVMHESGELASGLEGPGRLAKPERILDGVRTAMLGSKRLNGIKILVTAGPTAEPIDPVRFLSNRSTGKMGLALGEEAALRGADVTLVSGVRFAHVMDGIRCLVAATGRDMAETVREEWERHDVMIAAAAVADYRPRTVSSGKIKKDSDELLLRLERTEDILRKASAVKGDRIVVGFALETENGVENALRKLDEKDLDMICLNQALEPGSGFETDTNRITLIGRDRSVNELPLMPKWDAARSILDAIEPLLKNR